MSLYKVFYSLLIKILEMIPYKGLYYIGKIIAVFLYRLPNKHKKVSRANLSEVFPDIKDEDINVLLKDSLFHSSMSLLESGLVWGKKDHLKKGEFLQVINFKAVEKSLSSGNGVLLFTPHIGNIEVLINFLGSKTHCTIPYTRPKNTFLDKIITDSRNRAGVKMVGTDSKGMREILNTLKNKNVVAIASDQVPKDGAGIMSTFFNKEIYTMKLLPKLRQKTECNIHLMYCERKDKGKGFIVHFSEEIELPLEIKAGADRMNKEFEKCIMAIPGQYSWEYKKFKKTHLKSIY